MTSQFVSDLPVNQNFPGVRTPFGIQLPPGGRVAAYLRSTGAQSGDDITIGSNLVTTLSAALSRVRSGMGDTIIALPGHAENVTTTPTWVAGTRLIGIPLGTSTPTFTWSATSSQWAINVANVWIQGCKLAVSGAVVVKGIYVTGANFSLVANEIVQASGASNKATILCEYDTGADNALVQGNYVYGTATHNSTDVFLVTAAVNQFRFVKNTMICSGTDAKGHLHVVGAALNCYVADNDLYNTHTSSTTCIGLDNVASDGICCRNTLATAVGTGTAPASAGIVLAGTNTLWRFFENYSTPTKNTSGIICPVVDS